MSENENSPRKSEDQSLVIPAFAGSREVHLELQATKLAESRLIEAKTVNPVTYVDLEHAFMEAYRELRKHAATIGFQIAKADKAMEQAKAQFLIDKYPDIMAGKPRSHDSADTRKAYLMREPDYLAALDRMNMLKAMESYVDGRIRVFENVSRYMKKQMDLVLRSGLSNADLYNTNGRRPHG